MGSTVKELINEITENRNKDRQEGITRYDTKSQKDEVNIMRAMMNDQSYSVRVYDNYGRVISTYCPAKDIRKNMSSIIQGAMGIGEQEADHVMDNYEFKNGDAQCMINLSKEFVNTYLQSGRKLPLGGRDRSNVTLMKKTIPGGTMLYPNRINKKSSYESTEITTQDYDTIKVIGSCPEWRKSRNS